MMMASSLSEVGKEKQPAYSEEAIPRDYDVEFGPKLLPFHSYVTLASDNNEIGRMMYFSDMFQKKGEGWNRRFLEDLTLDEIETRLVLAYGGTAEIDQDAGTLTV